MFTGYKERLILLTLIVVFSTLPVYGQVKDWGDVSREVLAMDVYSPDSSASAVVLFDKAEIYFDNKLEYIMNRHVRIKILNQEGYDWATTEVVYDDDIDQDVYDIEGYTYRLNEKEKIEKQELDKDSIFEEEISEDVIRTKFTLPSIEPGAVIEYKYTKRIGSPYLLPDWDFHRSIPVAWSEYKVRIPEWFSYNKMISGGYPVYIHNTEPFHDTIFLNLRNTSGFFNRRTQYRNMRIDISGFVYRWVMKDLPAIRELPYMASVEDHKSKLWIQLTDIRIPNQIHQSFLKTWGSIAKELRKADGFGERLESESETREIARKLTAGINDPTQKMSAIYDFMVESMVWDGSYSMLASQDLEDMLGAKKGSSAELNLLMVQLLRDAGLTANPVVLSTRDHGKVNEYFAIANQFNHVIAKVDLEKKSYLLDATSEDNAINILPINDLNRNGLLIGKEQTEWVKLAPKTKSKKKIVINGKLNNNGKLAGNLYLTSSGYMGSEEFVVSKNEGEESFVNETLFGEYKEVSIDSFEVVKRKPAQGNFKCNVNFSNLSLKQSQQTADYLYFNPMLFLKEHENPFTQPERKIPVEYPYAFEKEFIGSFTVPEGYTIEEIPKTKKISIPGKGIHLTRVFQISGARIMVLSKLKIEQKTFSPKLYQNLRQFYSHVVDLHNEQIVLKSVSASSDS